MLLKRPLAQEIWLGSPDCFSSWEGGVWGRDYLLPRCSKNRRACLVHTNHTCVRNFVIVSIKSIVTREMSLQIVAQINNRWIYNWLVEHSWRHAMATILLCRFCLSKVDARHASGLFTIRGELEDIFSGSGERQWAASVCLLKLQG